MMRPSQTARRAWLTALAALTVAMLASGCSAEASRETAMPAPAQRAESTATPNVSDSSADVDAESTGSGDPALPAERPKAAVKVRAATVTRVVDGDTIHVRFSDGASDKVRFIGVDTPESTIQHEPYGEEASAYTKRALQGKRVFLQTDAELRDRYGRLLAYIWLAEPQKASTSEMRASLFNAKLLLDGYASVLTIPPNVKYAEQFLVFQREARDADRGLWALPPTENQGERSDSDAGDGSRYIGNANTKKFHYAECSSVDDMNPANKVPLDSRAEAIDRGFVPCKRCDP